MAELPLLFLLVLGLFTQCTLGRVQVKGIYLTKAGQQQQYMNLGSDDLNYQLECHIEGDLSAIVNVTWSLDKWGVVYTWVPATRSVAVMFPLKEHVRTPGEGVEVGPDIQFTSPDVSMHGLYTCSVYHTATDLVVNPVSDQYSLQMYAFFQEEYSLSARVERCTVYWSYSTPRMYPKPEVQCGFWDTSSGVLVKEVRGGLVFHQDLNFVWHVFVQDTPIEVRDAPRGTSFHCTTRVTIANYTRHTHLPTNSTTQLVYDTIENEGCPVLPALAEHMDVRVDGCRLNCRGECHQAGSQPVTAEYRCDPGYWSYWEADNSLRRHWRLLIRCDEARRTWVSEDGSQTLDMPFCMSRGTAGASCSVFILGLAALISCLPWTPTPVTHP
ncbi:uncharacterized protein [Procambarus clarkii]|uniref:uncharacterized protein n=1 Tax=Procambarus clarkii TaxID=6728 RepID=UPI0037426BBF